MSSIQHLRLGWMLLLAAFAGCGSGVESGQVEGRVLLDGRPLDQVRVLYLPDPRRGSTAVGSSAVTDDNGFYRLRFQTAGGGEGAAVGWHRVTLEDLAAENARGSRPQPMRLDPAYSSAHDTPLSFRVRPGRQKNDLLLSSTSGS